MLKEIKFRLTFLSDDDFTSFVSTICFTNGNKSLPISPIMLFICSVQFSAVISKFFTINTLLIVSINSFSLFLFSSRFFPTFDDIIIPFEARNSIIIFGKYFLISGNIIFNLTIGLFLIYAAAALSGFLLLLNGSIFIISA